MPIYVFMTNEDSIIQIQSVYRNESNKLVNLCLDLVYIFLFQTYLYICSERYFFIL